MPRNAGYSARTSVRKRRFGPLQREVSIIGQGTGGVTEASQNRVVMPLTGIYEDTDHVLGHELVRHPVCKAHRLELGKSRWLFPGARAGRPMEPVSLAR